ncbi:uncharacterized protein PV07_12811, partial [Cladophialophora immunda]
GDFVHVLVTTRQRDMFRQIAEVIELPPLSDDEAIQLFQLQRGSSPGEYVPAPPNLITRLGGLPLLITQMAALLKRRQKQNEDMTTLLSIYETDTKEILQFQPRFFWAYRSSAYATFDETMQAICRSYDRQEPLVSNFLTLLAFFDSSTPLNQSLFRRHWESNTDRSGWMSLFTRMDRGSKPSWDGDRFWRLLSIAYNSFLLDTLSYQAATFSVHRVMRDWLKLRIAPADRPRYTQDRDSILTPIIGG